MIEERNDLRIFLKLLGNEDYYDYEKLEFLYEQDALGWANGYELYGSWNNKYVWKSGSEVDAVYTTVYK